MDNMFNPWPAIVGWVCALGMVASVAGCFAATATHRDSLEYARIERCETQEGMSWEHTGWGIYACRAALEANSND